MNNSSKITLDLRTNHDEALEMVRVLIQNELTYDIAMAIMRQAEIDRDEVFTKDGRVIT